MTGSWDAHKDAISTIEGSGATKKRVVSKALLSALNYVDKIKILYDPATPVSIVQTLKRDKDNSVCLAAHQRPRVISGDLKNPFEV